MSLFTNLDYQHLTNRGRELHDRKIRQDEFINERIRNAEEADRKGLNKTDTIFEWQRRGQYTYDVYKDDSDDILKDENGDWLTSLPVYQRVVTEDGEWELELPEAAIRAIRNKVYCGICEERQPEDDILRREKQGEMLATMDAHMISLPDHVRRDDDLCVVCGAVLGFAGVSSRKQARGITAEQKEILGLE